MKDDHDLALSCMALLDKSIYASAHLSYNDFNLDLPTLEKNEQISFADPRLRACLVLGWYHVEEGYRWSAGSFSIFGFSSQSIKYASNILIEISPFVSPTTGSRNISVHIENKVVLEKEISTHTTISIPLEAAHINRKDTTIVELRYANPESPASQENLSDHRSLAFQYRSLRIITETGS